MPRSPTDPRRASSRLVRWTLLSTLALPLTAGKLKLPNPMAGIKEGLRVGYVAGSKVHAYQSYAFVYGFAQGNTMNHQRALDRLERDGLPLMTALRDAGLRPKLEVSVEPSPSGINVYGVDLVVLPKSGPPVRLPGRPGSDPATYHAASAKIAALSKLPAVQVEAGHGAWYGLSTVLTSLDAEASTLLKHAFALRVMQEQVQAGQQADWFDPTRPAAETLADTDAALSLLGDDIDRVRADQAAVLALFLMGTQLHVPGVPEALVAEIGAQRATCAEWLASHRQPTMEDFGISYQLPNPESVKKVIDEQLGVVGSAVKVARGVATGDLPRTLDGIAGLAPKDTKLRAVAEGVAAISKGDVRGTLGAIADLGGPETKVGAVAARLEKVAAIIDKVP
ncbi:MAG: hypothetical protein JNM72_25975 [Deltaproteobacteria bacterium]|nr:hypothetical protein [Deltaproteobacteria bacterium]